MTIRSENSPTAPACGPCAGPVNRDDKEPV
jgi:hypothetical protein